MFGWINSMLAGVTGEVSSKRVITLMAFILCGFAFVVDLFSSYSIDSKLFDSMMYIVIAGLGFTASEKFSNKKGP